MSARARDHFRREEAGFIFQNFNLLSNLTALENVLVPFLPRGVTSTQRRTAGELLERLGLGNRSEHRPNQLSGGEQQRIAMARALLAKPEWLFLDEATSALDEESENRLYEMLKVNLPSATIISIGHRSTLIAFHKRRLHMQRGPDGIFMPLDHDDAMMKP